MAMGTVDQESVVGRLPRPYAHIFLRSKAVWWEVGEGDGIERWEGFPGVEGEEEEDGRSGEPRLLE